ncbi:MAG: DUF465 domain-containing protein [Candidatus Saccharicenans sp.]|nr:DUF465 domain-containing protein [Candidatus Saccharicenans sp.]MDI6848983.1 DUF465 domain-containing protein [Candidatus Saccharicenans sp.]
MTEEKIKEILLKNNENFRKIHQEHQQCEQSLDQLRSKSFLTEEERLQEKMLKKKKLKLKDEMYRMILEYRQRTGGHE